MSDFSGEKQDVVTDEELMAQLSRGDLEALGELYKRYGRMVRAAIARIVPQVSQSELEDLTSEVFLALNDSAGRYLEKARLKSWLYSIAVRRTKDWRRSRWLHNRILSKNKERCAGIALRKIVTPDVSMELRDEVERALAELPDGQREVLWLFEAEGFSGEEIAEMLGISPESVFTRLHRARKRLEKYLAAQVSEGRQFRGSV